MIIRDFRRGDFDKGLLECLRALSPTEFSKPGTISHFIRARRKAGVRTFVMAERDESGKQVIVGTCSVFVEPKFIHGGSKVGHIEDVCVHPDWQGKSVGTALVCHVIEFCRASGCYKVVLYCDPSLRSFYERAGFYHNGASMRVDLNPVQD